MLCCPTEESTDYSKSLHILKLFSLFGWMSCHMKILPYRVRAGCTSVVACVVSVFVTVWWSSFPYVPPEMVYI